MNNHFMEYNDILNRISEVQAKIIEIKENIYSIKGISYDDVPRGKNGAVDILYFLAEIEELEKELKELLDKKNLLRKKHEKEIDKLSNSKHRSVLRMYYLMKFDVYRIADTLKITKNHVHKIKREATKEFMILNECK